VADADIRPPEELLLVASLHGEPDGVGVVNLMWVAQPVLGLSAGRRILYELEGRARANRLRLVRLGTNQDLSEAIRLCQSSGYREVTPFNDNPYAHYWFEQPLT
jgi:hypothetical protein